MKNKKLDDYMVLTGSVIKGRLLVVKKRSKDNNNKICNYSAPRIKSFMNSGILP